ALIDEGIINLVPKGSRTHFLWSRAYSLSNLGVRQEDMLEVLTSICEDHCEAGKAYAASKEGRRTIQNIAHDGKVTYKIRHSQVPTYGDKFGKYVETINQFPNSLEATEVYQRLFLDGKVRNNQHIVRRYMTRAG